MSNSLCMYMLTNLAHNTYQNMLIFSHQSLACSKLDAHFTVPVPAIFAGKTVPSYAGFHAHIIAKLEPYFFSCHGHLSNYGHNSLSQCLLDIVVAPLHPHNDPVICYRVEPDPAPHQIVLAREIIHYCPQESGREKRRQTKINPVLSLHLFLPCHGRCWRRTSHKDVHSILLGHATLCQLFLILEH